MSPTFNLMTFMIIKVILCVNDDINIIITATMIIMLIMMIMFTFSVIEAYRSCG